MSLSNVAGLGALAPGGGGDSAGPGGVSMAGPSWLYCNSCGAPPSSPFYIAECSHMLCNRDCMRDPKDYIDTISWACVKSRRRLLHDLESTSKSLEDTQMKRVRDKAISELLSSEKTYLKHLELVEEYFMRPLEGRRDWLTQSDFVTLFGDLPAILQVNRELLASLQTSSDAIGAVFLELAPYLKFYSTYAQDFQVSVKLVERYTDKHRGFRAWIQDQESRPEVQMKLNALLITPVQRIPRYKLLLEDLIKNTPDCHSDKKNLQRALTQIDAVAWHINDQLKEHENSLKMVDIQKSLQGCWPKIVIPGRRLVLQGNLMKVPRAGGSGQPRYFVLFSDMLMYCKIKISGLGTLILPKPNALECGCMMPLKHTKVQTLVGKGVFKVTCQKEELILYSSEGRSEEWVDMITETIEKHKRDAATLRKESSRRDPIKRPQILKMRRDSLSQIMMNHSKSRMTSKPTSSSTSPIKFPKLLSPMRKKRQAPDTPGGRGDAHMSSPEKLQKVEEVLEESPQKPNGSGMTTPRRSVRLAEAQGNKENDHSIFVVPTTPVTRSAKKKAPSPPAPQTPPIELRKKKVQRPHWKSLSLTRKEKIQAENANLKSSSSNLFRSPSLYEPDSSAAIDQQPSVMTSYLSGKLCPLTPSQRQTDISHLVQQELKEKIGEKNRETTSSARKPLFNGEVSDDESSANHQLVTASFFQRQAAQEGNAGHYCAIM